MFLNGLAVGCGGFLLAVLWMDLMFDVQVRRHPDLHEIPDEALASIAGYYRRVTTQARPMTHLIAVVMLVGVTSVGVQFVRGDVPGWLGLASLTLIAVPVTLAALRTVANAIRLGRRTDSLLDQSNRARGIFKDHLFCFAAIVAFLVLRLWALLA